MEEVESGEDQYGEVWKLCCDDPADGTKVNAFRRSHYFLKDLLKKDEIHSKVKSISIDSEIIGGKCDSFESWKEFSATIGELEFLETLSFSCFFRSWDVSDRTGVTADNDECSRLAYAVGKAKQIKNLEVTGSFSYVEGSDDGAAWDASMMSLFARSLIAHPSLETFTVREFDFDNGETIEFLLHALSTVPNLRSVTLSPGQDRSFDDVEYHPMCDAYFLARLSKVPSLRHLQLTNFYLNADQCRTLGTSLAASTSSVSKLALFSCCLSGSQLFDAVQDSTALKELWLYNVGLENNDPCALDKLARHNKSITSLVLGDGTFLDSPESWRGTLSALSTNSTIQHLSISENSDALVEVDWSEVLKLVRQCLKANPNLQSLDLCQNGLTDKVGDDLALVIADDNHLTKLSLSCNEFTDAGWSKLMPAVVQSPRLKHLEIDGEVTPEAQVAFVAGLPRRSGLKSLALSFRRGNVAPIRGSAAEAILQAVRENYALEDLQVSVDDDTRKKIATILRLNKAGRSYLWEKTGAPMAVKGLAVLASVSDNLDDVFYHLRNENPSLCKPGELSLASRKRKRS